MNATRSSFVPWLALARLAAPLALGAALLVPRTAEACQTCESASECPRGFGCDGGVCMALHCQADSECSAGMRCVKETATECDGDATHCHPVNSCAPVWQGGCTKDEHCGPAFRCNVNGMLCTGSSCEPIGMCEQREPSAACETDSDCPACWSCTGDPGVACFNPGGLPDQPPAGPGPRVCRPPYWGLSVSYEGRGPGDDASPPTAACGASAPAGASPQSVLAGPAPVTTGPSGSANGAGGCAVAGGSERGTWMWLVGLGAVLATARRRRR
jgi:MYXO-CTERM domain-containing protein